MVNNSTKHCHLLARVNFPLYGVKVLSSRHIVVAGGGGSASTGIPNTCEIYELIYDNVNNTCKARLVTHYDTGSRAIMNLCVVNKSQYCYHLLCGGMDGICTLYEVRLVIESNNRDFSMKRERTDSGSALRRRRTSSTSSNTGRDSLENGENVAKLRRRDSKPAELSDEQDGIPDFRFEVKQQNTFKTDFTVKEPFLKVIRFCVNNNIVVTGGDDGHIRVWSYPKLELIHDIKGHNTEVIDLDINSVGSRIASLASRDGKGFIWDTTTATLVTELKYQIPVKQKIETVSNKYVFRGSRFGIVEGDVNNCRLFTIMNPLVISKPPLNSYIFKWNTTNYTVEKMVSAGQDSLSTMTISDDGRFIGLGTSTGSVDVYISFSLQRVYHYSKAHNLFVTGVEFLKSCVETEQLTGGYDAALLSVSVDNHIVVHEIPKRATLGFIGSSTFFIVFMLIIYVLMNYLGL